MSEAGSEMLISRPGEGLRFRMDWGEEVVIRQTAAASGDRLCVMDVKAPANFGPGRHVHREDDEVMLLHRGELVVWSPEKVSVARAGDIVFLPRRRPHTWFNHGDQEAELTLFVTPGQLEIFFPIAHEKGLTGSDIDGLIKAVMQSGVDPCGPPLTREEAAAFVTAAGAV